MDVLLLKNLSCCEVTASTSIDEYDRAVARKGVVCAMYCVHCAVRNTAGVGIGRVRMTEEDVRTRACRANDNDDDGGGGGERAQSYAAGEDEHARGVRRGGRTSKERRDMRTSGRREIIIPAASVLYIPLYVRVSSLRRTSRFSCGPAHEADMFGNATGPTKFYCLYRKTSGYIHSSKLHTYFCYYTELFFMLLFISANKTQTLV
jgi:hypothetical protein